MSLALWAERRNTSECARNRSRNHGHTRMPIEAAEPSAFLPATLRTHARTHARTHRLADLGAVPAHFLR